MNYSPDFELVWYTPTQAGVASRYEKMEIGLKPSQEILDRIDFFFQNGGASPTALNPFNRHDIDFQMTLFHNGQPIDRVDAFYYTPQKIVANEMIDDTTSYPFRFRHSPREAGSYTAQVDLFVSEYLWKRIYFDFTVVESTNKGFLEKGKHNDLWASMCSGSAIPGLDWWGHHNPARFNLWYESFQGIRNFFADIDFENINYDKIWGTVDEKHYSAQRFPRKSKDIKATNYYPEQNVNGYTKSDAIEGFAMIADDKSQGFGWAHNRSNYWMNNTSESSCINDMVKGQGAWSHPHLFRSADDDTISVVRSINTDNDFVKFRHLKVLHHYFIDFQTFLSCLGTIKTKTECGIQENNDQ